MHLLFKFSFYFILFYMYIYFFLLFYFVDRPVSPLLNLSLLFEFSLTRFCVLVFVVVFRSRVVVDYYFFYFIYNLLRSLKVPREQ